MYEQKRLEWEYRTSPTPAAVADALENAAAYEIPADWAPQRLLVIRHETGFRVSLDLAEESE